MNDTKEFRLAALHTQACATLEAQLRATTTLASSEVQHAVPLLVRALGPAMATIQHDLVLEMIEELNGSGITSGLYVKTTSDGQELAVEHPSVLMPDADDGTNVRITLRLPENIRDAINAEIADSATSLNSWLVAAAREKLARQQTDHRSKHKVTGWSIS
ncbi:hypothetical protein [Arcanobacterium phocae]|uniref:hypothetical protein n=1 Tax=Arcanobacterium phocae TaxID=131112 RepID=UPI001C0F140D|nr:hypothetical protein [Arcanobacterium phocae]